MGRVSFALFSSYFCAPSLQRMRFASLQRGELHRALDGSTTKLKQIEHRSVVARQRNAGELDAYYCVLDRLNRH